MATILFITILTISALYVPQPLLPTLAREFAVSRETAALMTTVTLFPLSLAPLLYGYLLESISPLKLIRVSLILLLLSEIPFLFSDSFNLLLSLRFFQGLLIPAILTALMTFVSSNAKPSEVARSMALYISATIVGGFLGRFISGMIATIFHWRLSFVVLGLSLLISLFPLLKLKGEFQLPTLKPTPADIKKTLFQRGFTSVYLAIFFMFFVFAAIMNFVPFRLVELNGAEAKWLIGWVYSGYLMGIVTALAAVRIRRYVGSEHRVMLVGFTVYTLSLILMIQESTTLLFVAMFIFCGAMFLIHATATGYINGLAQHNRGIVNGVYVSSYYGGGALGSILPGFAYQRWGWSGVVILLMIISIIGLLTILLSGKHAASPNI